MVLRYFFNRARRLVKGAKLPEKHKMAKLDRISRTNSGEMNAAVRFTNGRQVTLHFVKEGDYGYAVSFVFETKVGEFDRSTMFTYKPGMPEFKAVVEHHEIRNLLEDGNLRAKLMKEGK